MAGDRTPQRLQSACSHERAQSPPDSIFTVCPQLPRTCVAAQGTTP